MISFESYTHSALEFYHHMSAKLSLLDPKSLLILCLILPLAAQYLISKKTKKASHLYPPIVPLTEHDIFENPKEAYEGALREHGSVIGVKRKGRGLEYIVSSKHVKEVLNDDASFSFEKGSARILNLDFVMAMHDDSFYKDMDAIVSDGISPRLDDIIMQIQPIYQRNAARMLKERKPVSLDMFDYANSVVAEGMLLIIMGESYCSPQNTKAVVRAAGGIAELTGIYSHQSRFARYYPALWRMMIRIKVLVFIIMFEFMPKFGPSIWKDLSKLSSRRVKSKGKQAKYDRDQISLMSILAEQHAREDGTLAFTSKLWIICLLLGIIFSSVHQTVVLIVWVMFELTKRPEYLQTIREECLALSIASDGSSNLARGSWRDARYLDSFIREVMRLKGDTLSTIRVTTKDVPLGRYIIPKGHSVLPMATLCHLSTEHHGEKASEFQGFRWVEEEKPAVMTSPGFLTFGLGRWACPGRLLAVAEIKLMIQSLIALSTPELIGGSYQIVDKLTITSVPPVGKLVLIPL